MAKINIKIEGFYLRRPISVCDYDDETITIIYKILGFGTEKMATLEKGVKLDCLIGLGNGFVLEEVDEENILVVGGGVGVPPLYRLTKELLKLNKNVTVLLGFNSKDEVFYEEEFKALGVKTYVSTMDGSYQTKGVVTDLIKEHNIDFDYYMTCGPMPLLRAIWKTGKKGKLSFEERMGCGFGACMGCSIQTVNGPKRVCKEGPVFEASEVLL